MHFIFYPCGIDETKSLIYLWQIQDPAGQVIYRYIGKANKGSKRPLKHYSNNVRRYLAGEPYRKGNPDGYRESHRRLGEAVQSNSTISLYLVRNVPIEERIFDVERRLHDLYCAQPFCELPDELIRSR